MAIVNAKSLCVSGTYLLDRAKRLALRLVRFNRQSNSEIIDGYLIRATRNGASATAVIIDPPGQLLVFDARLDDRGNAYPAGPRDQFDSRVGLASAPLDYEDVEPKTVAPKFVALGFDPTQQGPLAPWQQAFLWRSYSTAHRDVIRAHALRVFPPPGSSYPYDSADQVPAGSLVYSGVQAYPRSEALPGYWLAESFIEQYAPGYRLLARTNLGYMSFEYQGMQGASASTGSWTLLVLPVVTNVDPDAAHSWGNSALLFLLLNYQAAQAGQQPATVAWSKLWSPDQHSVDFFHNGPWLARPRRSISSPFEAPQNAWSAFWDAWEAGGRVVPAGGSRPNWTDALGVAWFNGRFVVNARLCALNATLSDPGAGWDFEYVDAGGAATVRFEVGLDGDFQVDELTHEVWDSADPTNPGRRRPYDVWVAGHLDEARVHAVNPVATIPLPGGLVEVTWRMEGNRSGIFSLGEGPFMPADLASGRLEFSVTLLDTAGQELPAVVYQVRFEELGAGIQGPTIPVFSSGTSPVLMPPTGSYKLWPLAPMFVPISKYEVAFACYEAWQDFGTGVASPVHLAVFDLRTGRASLRSAIGFSHQPAVQHQFPVHVSCMQRTVFDAAGNIVLEAVLFASVETENAVRVSRDSGRTWTDYLTFPRPRAGAYYLGSPLLASTRGGAAILED